MSICLQPECLNINNSEHKFCQKCGKKLLLSERYRAIKKIGEGGFGVTFYALDEHRWDTPCVIKQFIPLQSGSGALNKCYELFKQESKLLKELGKHPQIPDLLAFFEQEGKIYLIQEFINGQDLYKQLQIKKRYSEAEIKQFLVSLLSIIEFVHSKNILHRDIKLDNIIQRQDGVLILIDFGISKQTTATIATQMGTIAGTQGYAAPEQMQGFANPTSDLYSLAITAVRMLTGCVSEVKNGSTIDELFDILNWEWIWKPYLSKKGISISKELAEILAKMLEDKVNNRFQSATEILQILNSQTSEVAPPITISNPKQTQPTILSTPPIKPAKSATFFYNQGLAFFNEKKYQEAISDLTQAIRINPRFAEAYHNRGLTYNNLKRYQKAIADYTQAIRINPQDAEAYNNRGFTYDELQKYQEAIADFVEAISIRPDLLRK